MSSNEDKELLESVSAGHLEDNDVVDCCKCGEEVLFSQSYSCPDGLCCRHCILKFYK